MFRNRSTTSARRRSSFRPSCEPLETRWVPTTVTNLDDAGPGSLRQAIVDTASGGIVAFEEGLSGTIFLTTGQLTIRKHLVINSPSADVITVSGNNQSRVFNIAAGFNVQIYGLTISHGRVELDPVGGGGAILNAGNLLLYGSNVTHSSANAGGPGTITYRGGAILNSGTLTLAYSTLLENRITASAVNSAFALGGGIYNSGNLSLEASAIHRNTAFVSGPRFGGGARGAGLYNAGTVVVRESTISSNSASNSFSAAGGGLYNEGTAGVFTSTISGNAARRTGSGAISLRTEGGGIANIGRLTVSSSTISGNTALSASPADQADGGGIGNSGSGTITLRNTIVAPNTASTGPDLAGLVMSEGYNLIGDGSGSSGLHASDLVGTAETPLDPLLGPLGYNGGGTLTHALLPGSPALDAGDPTDAPEFDQRGEGFFRIVGDNIDIGAFESQGESSPGAGASGQDFAPLPVDLDAAGLLLWLSRSRGPGVPG